MQRYLLTLVVLMIPALIALGHDVYLYSQNMEKPFELTDYGYIWTTYSPESFAKFMTDSNSEARSFTNILLEQKAVVVGVAYGVFLFVGMAVTYLILKLLFGSLGGSTYARSGSGGLNADRDKPGKFVYKRK